MQSLSIPSLSDSDAVNLYHWLERDSSAVLKCTCRQVRRIKTVPSLSHALGGQNLFLHHQTPGLVAEICGMVVGVAQKEDQVTYHVDDGTSMLRIMETRKSLQQTQFRILQIGSSASTVCGVPECYIMPSEPKAFTSARFQPPLNQRFEVADIVKCTGKVQIDREGKRFLLAQQMVSVKDVNVESQHQIDVVKFQNEVYRKPFDWSRISFVKTDTARAPETFPSSSNWSARPLVSRASPNDKAVPVPSINVLSERQGYADRHRLSANEARELLSNDQTWLPVELSKMPRPSSSRVNEQSRSTQIRTRQLRAHDKIADHKLTENYFQLQLQQHISFRFHCEPFTSSDLWSDAGLVRLARRLVSVRLQHRMASRSANKPRCDTKDDFEHPSEKVRRLFEWAIRKMVQDGFITLSDADRPRQPFSRDSALSDADWYCLITPEYLLKPMRKVLGSKTTASTHGAALHDVDDLTARLRNLDDRFRFVNCSLVQDSLALYTAHRDPIEID
ncbi:uncharacterized protein MEPE_02018 [Melanopsichium pennsylvanicum]|uniref:CST complex subunit STN1 n=1 Tax=Melanopsichium pennsylvanicum TaxID=63383 RepID=A0AAJ5C450_9BASI|nr:uncharacterized protein MEPE_02018 [Melanopsichium pennsylvanicum]